MNIGGQLVPELPRRDAVPRRAVQEVQAQGLEIVGLSFEEEAQLKNPVRLRAFIKRYGVEYTVLLPGEPKELNDKVPQGVNLNSFPTSFFLGRDGRVRSAHAGFPGKASGQVPHEAEGRDHGARRAAARRAAHYEQPARF